jgi:prophage DNA circulation protein
VIETLAKAAFRGLEFSARDLGMTAGRRVVFTDLPGIDGCVSEDMGKAARKYRVEALFIGETWFEDYQRMVGFVEEHAQGDYRHPDGTVIYATVSGLTEFSIEGVGCVSCRLTFVEELDIRVESTGVTTPFIDETIAYVTEPLVEAWEPEADNIETVTDICAGIEAALETGRQAAAEALIELATVQAQISALVTVPATLAEYLFGVYEQITDFDTLTLALTQYHLLQLPSLSTWASLTDPDDQANARNAYELHIALAAAALAYAAAVVDDTEFVALDDAQAACQRVSDLIEELSAFAATSTMSALLDLQASLVDSVLIEAQELPRLMNFTPWHTMSAHEIAQYLYGDSARASEITDRNKIQHPGFITPAQTLRVLED